MARRILWSYVLPAHLVGTSAIFIQSWFYETTFIHGSSMSPTLSPDYATSGAMDMVLWRKFSPTEGLRRGDVVLFDTPHSRDGSAVKRVIALPGDVVLLDPKRRPEEVMNGRVNEAAKKWDIWRGRVQVPQGHVWVEGDNWRKTRDSNEYGCVSKSLIQGRAVRMVWPLGRFWTTPWERYTSGTKVVGGERVGRPWDPEKVNIGWWETP